MNFTQTKINRSVISTAIALGLGLAAFQANAVVIDQTVSFTTLAEPTVTEVTALNYGANVSPSAGGVCTLTPDNTASELWDAGAGTGFTGVAISGNDAITLSGTGCLPNDISAGVYVITGTANSTIKVTLFGVTETDYSFSPEGLIDLTDDTADAGTALTMGTPATIAIGAGGEVGLVVGGDIDIINDLTPDLLHTANYTVEITY